MEGITTSIDLFDHSKRTVFQHDDLLGRISSEDDQEFTAEPAKKDKPIRKITGELEAIQYLVDCTTRKVVSVPVIDRAQMALF